MTLEHEKERMITDILKMKEDTCRRLDETIRKIELADTNQELITAMFESPMFHKTTHTKD